jgi:hypothetical protein
MRPDWQRHSTNIQPKWFAYCSMATQSARKHFHYRKDKDSANQKSGWGGLRIHQNYQNSMLSEFLHCCYCMQLTVGNVSTFTPSPSQYWVYLLQLPGFGMSPFYTSDTKLQPNSPPQPPQIVSYLSRFHLLAENRWCTVFTTEHFKEVFVQPGGVGGDVAL